MLHPLEISHEFFLVSLGNSTLFLINPWKFCMLFLEYSWKFYFLTLPPHPPCLFFSGIVQSRRPCASSNTFLYRRMKITYPMLLVDFFHKLISMQDVCHMLHLHVHQQLPSLQVHAPVS